LRLQSTRIVMVVQLIAAAVGPAWTAGPADRLPAEVRSTLDHDYRGWRFARLDPALHRLLAVNDSPEWLKGDYDGDGKVDCAVNIVNEGSDNPQKLVILLRRSKGFEQHVLKSGPVNTYTFLRPVRKGETRTDVTTGKTYTSATDAIDVIYGEKAGVTYLFVGDHFRRIISGD